MRTCLNFILLLNFFSSCAIDQVLLPDQGDALLYSCARYNRISIEQLYLLEYLPPGKSIRSAFEFVAQEPHLKSLCEPLCDSLFVLCNKLKLPASRSENPLFCHSVPLDWIRLPGERKGIQIKSSEAILLVFWSSKRINAFRKILLSARLWRDAHPKIPLKIIPVNIDFARELSPQVNHQNLQK